LACIKLDHAKFEKTLSIRNKMITIVFSPPLAGGDLRGGGLKENEILCNHPHPDPLPSTPAADLRQGRGKKLNSLKIESQK
jgi:hypothetical protein